MSTLVAVQGFEPYTGMAEINRSFWEKHGWPVVTLSPVDSPMRVNGIVNIPLGMNQHAGALSLQRWRLMLEWLLSQKFDWYLMHEADSIYLGDESLPCYLFNPDVLFCNKMPENAVPPLQEYYCLAPWFFSRRVLARLVGAIETFQFVGPLNGDRWLGQLCAAAGVECRHFENGIGCGTLSTAPDRMPELLQVCEAVRHGARFIHGVKSADVQKKLCSSI